MARIAKEIPVPLINQPNDMIFLIAKEGAFALQRNDATEQIKMLGSFDLAKCIEIIQSDKEIELPIFIKNLIYYKQKGSCHKLILEYNPFLYTMALNLRGTEKTVSKHEIYLPYIQFYIQIDNLDTHLKISNSRVSCSKKPISSLDDNVYVPPLYNIYRNGTICYGTQLSLSNSNSVFEHAKKFVDMFFGSEFSIDISAKFPPEFPTLTAYEKISKERPYDVLKANFIPMGKVNDVWTLD